MPPRKKRKSAGAPKEPEEPLDFVTHIREKAQKRFASRRKNVNYDIEQNVREIRALLNINAEIFGRVIDSASNYSSGESVTLTRYGFDAVKVRQSGESTEFITEPVCSEDTFPINALLHLPDNLNGVLVVQYQAAPFNNFIDYNAFFRSALMLHDDILEPFLVKLKDHVESIHVLLGEMESWLLESQRKIEFIETTFDTKLETPSPGHLLVEEASGCNCSAHYGLTNCLRCSAYFQAHTRDATSGHRLCSPGKRFRCKKRVPKIHILKKYDHDGKFEKTFQITTESEQAKLKKCLEYMDS
mmetsp:Transcript_18028/g.36181  ORF Transcript_18028/g.36181 Transcript_18028/m.36181 type:complete len:300 (+) Transcript_18028:89-988(+)